MPGRCRCLKRIAPVRGRRILRNAGCGRVPEAPLAEKIAIARREPDVSIGTRVTILHEALKQQVCVRGGCDRCQADTAVDSALVVIAEIGFVGILVIIPANGWILAWRSLL